MQDDEPGFNAGEVMGGPMMEDRGGMNGPTMEDPERWRILNVEDTYSGDPKKGG